MAIKPVAADDNADADAPRRGIGSADKAVDMLVALIEAGRAAPLRDLARATDMPASLAHRYLSSLVARRLARQDGATGFYDLGPLAIRLGAEALGRVDPLALAMEAMPALCDETGLTVLLNVLGDSGPVIVRWQRSRVPFMTTLAVGATLPLTQSATGRVLLAFLPARPVARLIERDTAAPGLAARLAQIRTRGYDTADSTVIPGLAAISAPVLDAQDEAVAALTLVGAGPDVRPLQQKAIDALMATCRHVSGQCGSDFLARLEGPA
ncbi:IclR family transcriptional regulator [Phreatobacter stygius]|uniref:IclR family transcriptional regulator n=1 Tax=Phreatobacter stygius TaxID=1940610 RepID=A0A4D7B4W8_9HYPH|nr:IclR family transcriptional regulator [Phreatobacter stygius]QCI64736.1 IclR family transcriptional regulator [Phreatobacter stygius]